MHQVICPTAGALPDGQFDGEQMAATVPADTQRIDHDAQERVVSGDALVVNEYYHFGRIATIRGFETLVF